MAGLVQRDSRENRNLVLRSVISRLAVRVFFAEVGIIHLDLPPQHVYLLPSRQR